MTFAEWQPAYADRGIVTFPCGLDKKPLVKNWKKLGSNISAGLATKFPVAPALGFWAGRRNGITILDVDTTNERVLADAMDRHGRTNLVVRTGSGKFHGFYRHNGELRRIRPWPELPIDLIGADLLIAPPSIVTKGRYEIIHGHLDDLDRLPIMQGLDDKLYVRASGPQPQRQGEGRNNDLWRRAMREAHHVDDFKQLLDRVETLNQEYLEPMQRAEVTKIAESAWGYTERGENRFGRHGVWFPTDEANELIETAQREYLLLSYLRANNHPDSNFMVANGLAEKLGWKRHTLAAARESLVRRGYLRCWRRASQHTPALYRWCPRAPKAKDS